MWIPIVFGSQDKHNSNKRLILITECKGLLKKGIKRPVDVEFRFGCTVLQITATERKTQNKTSMEFNFIM
jgi:hypothetical protein